jgi:peroxiredoxin
LSLTLGLASLFGNTSLVWGAEVADLVQGYQLVPVNPPRPAADFTLPRFDGGEYSLSDFSGSWVILTFWASWCGPCRSEMPSLEALHRSHADRGVVVFGVSVDQDGPAGQAFIRDYDLTFPQAWDQRSEVGRIYQATAIPMSVLVDPAGSVVALSRGARDWTQLAGLMDQLIELVPPEPQSRAVYAESFDPPDVSDPPTAGIQVSNASPRPGQEFFLSIHLRWAGHMEEYIPQPPRVHLPEGVTQKGVTASSSSRDGAQIVLYRVTLQADEVGTFALDPVELRYQPRFAPGVVTSRLVGPTITVEPRTVVGMYPRTLAMVIGGVAITAFASAALVGRWRARRDRGTTPESSGFEDIRERFNEARSLRLQGDGAGHALAMMGLLAELREPSESETAELRSLEESLRFGGHVPPASELDRLEREVGRRLEALQPDPDLAVRQALRLQDHEERS